MNFFPGWPAFKIVFKIGYHNIFVWKLMANKFCLGTDMLYIKMPVVPGPDIFAHRLLCGAPISQGIKNEYCFFGRGKIGRLIKELFSRLHSF